MASIFLILSVLSTIFNHGHTVYPPNDNLLDNTSHHPYHDNHRHLLHRTKPKNENQNDKERQEKRAMRRQQRESTQQQQTNADNLSETEELKIKNSRKYKHWMKRHDNGNINSFQEFLAMQKQKAQQPKPAIVSIPKPMSETDTDIVSSHAITQQVVETVTQSKALNEESEYHLDDLMIDTDKRWNNRFSLGSLAQKNRTAAK